MALWRPSPSSSEGANILAAAAANVVAETVVVVFDNYGSEPSWYSCPPIFNVSRPLIPKSRNALYRGKDAHGNTGYKH